MYVAERTTPDAASAAILGSQRNAPSRMRNSPTNPFSPGNPIDESVTIRNTATSRGVILFKPPYSAISRVCRRSDSIPTMRKRPPVLTPWFSIWYTAPVTPCVFIAAIPSTTKPRWLTLE